MFEKLAQLWLRRNAVPREHKGVYGAFIALESLAKSAWTSRNHSAFAQNAMMYNTVVYRCVHMIAEAAASVPLIAYKGEEELDGHPLHDLIYQPHHSSSMALLEQIHGYLMVSGNAYVEASAIAGRLNIQHETKTSGSARAGLRNEVLRSRPQGGHAERRF